MRLLVVFLLVSCSSGCAQFLSCGAGLCGGFFYGENRYSGKTIQDTPEKTVKIIIHPKFIACKKECDDNSDICWHDKTRETHLGIVCQNEYSVCLKDCRTNYPTRKTVEVKK